MPWQQHAADVGGELVPDPVSGKLIPAYSKIVITIPRQNGKTTLVLSWVLDRALNWGLSQRSVYTAQTGKDGKNKVLEDWYPIIDRSPLGMSLGPILKRTGERKGVRRVNGDEGFRFLGGSALDVLPGTDSAGHGRSTDLGVIDEAWDDVDSTREAAIQPSQLTKDDSQLLVVSTMGTDASLYLNALVDAGRAAAVADVGFGVCFIEYSADPALDPGDPATWQSCMPALGHTITQRKVASLWDQAVTENKVGEFRRAYLNQLTASEERVISSDLWAKVCKPDVAPDADVFALDCNPERTFGAIAVADKTGRVELLDQERGIGWMVPRARSLRDKWGVNQFAVDPGGPAGALIPDLKAAGLTVVEVGGGTFTKACGLFFDAVADAKIQILADSRLDLACAAAAKRPSGDAWVWTRKSSSTDISPLVAITLAYWVSQQILPGSTYWSPDDL